MHTYISSVAMPHQKKGTKETYVNTVEEFFLIYCKNTDKTCMLLEIKK